MSHEQQTPHTANNEDMPTDKRQAPAEWQDGLGLEEIDLAPQPDLAQTLAVGHVATSLGKHSDNPDRRVRNRTPEDSAADLDSRTWSMYQVEREGLVRIPGPDGEVQHRILESTDGKAPNDGQTLFDWIISRHPSAVFAKEGDGYRGYVDPSGPDYNKDEQVE